MIRPLSSALVCCLSLSLPGCGELASDYTVQLVPHTLTGQDPFVDGRAVEFVVIEPDGRSSVYPAGTIQGRELRVEELPPVAADTFLGLLVEEPGGAAGAIDLDLAVAWGSARVEAPLEIGEQTVTVDVLVAEIGTIGDMGTLPANRKSLGAGVAMVPGGDVYLFGGATGTGANDVGENRILWMGNTDAGSWSFEKISETLTERDGVQGWFGVSATTIDVDGSTQIFVSGGRAQPGILPGQPTRAAYLFDPETQTFAWGHKDAHDSLTVARSEHGHVVMDNGRIVIYGGYTSSTRSSIEVFNPKNKSFEYLDSLTHGSVLPAAASLGTGGALICGGGEPNGAGPDTTAPMASCDTITLGGVVAPSEDMPLPVMAHAMAQLADGRILATGGLTSPVDDLQTIQASEDAWIFNGTSWSPVSGKMKYRRAHHRVIPTPDGNAIILGGATNGGAIFGNPSPAVICAEIFDAASQTFTEIRPCTAAGGGASPGVSALPSEGAFVLAGADAAQSPNGDVYGYIAFTPDL